MCDSIANGGPRAVAEKCCPPANVIIASNVLDTTGNVIAGNIISVDGTFTGNLYVSGNIVSNITYSSLNVTGPINGTSIWGTTFFGNGSGLDSLNASNLTGTISNINLPPSGVVAGTYGSNANVSQITVDQYGIVTVASNVSIVSSQWTTVDGNVAYQNGVSIGTLSAPPVGSNLYVLGSANITDTLNVSTLYANSATIFGSATLNVFGISNLSTVLASLYIGNGSGLSNLNSSNLVGNVASANVALVVSQPAQPNVTSVGVLTSLDVGGLLQASLITGNGSGISNINSSNLVGNVARANVALVVSQPAQPNVTSVGILTSLNVSGISNLNSITSSLISGDGSGISSINGANVSTVGTAQSVTNAAQPNVTSLGTLTGLAINGLLVVSNASGLSNINASNLIGNVAAANVASSVTNPSQPNITSVGTLTGLVIQGLLVASNGSGISNINGSNIVSTVGTAQSVTSAAQPNITSVGTLTSLSVTGSLVAGTISGDGQGIFGIHPSSITGTVATSNSVVQPAQPNITSVGTLTSLTVSGIFNSNLISGNGSAISNINGANVSTVGTAQSVTLASQPNITSLGILNSLNVSGISNLNSVTSSFISGNGSGISNINSSNLTGTISTGNFPTSGVTAGLYGSGANVSSVTVDQYGRITAASNIAITASQWTSNTGNTIYYANYVGIGDTFVPSANLHVIGNAYVSNSVTTTNIFFTNTIQDTNLPTTSVTPGSYGSVANIPQIVVDQYGRITSGTNLAFISSTQWTSVDGNVAYQNGVSIGTLSNPPVGSNLYVLGNANIGTINTLSANIGTLVVPTQFNVVSANLFTSNIVDLSVRNLANIVSANVVTINVYNSNNWISNIGTLNIAFSATVTNLTIRTNSNIFSSNTTTANITNLTVRTLANLFSSNIITSNIASGNIVTGNVVTLNVSTAANVTNLTVRTLANLVSANITTANIASGNIVTGNVTTLNVSTAANVTNLTVSTLANLISSNITTANILTLNAFSIFGQNSNLETANVTTENVVTLNAFSIFGQNSNLVTLNASSIFGQDSNLVTLNAFSIFAQNSNLVTANVTTGNVVTLNASSIFGQDSNLATLNAFSIFGQNSNIGTSNITTSNILTLNASSIFGTNSNIGTLNTSSIFAQNSNLVTANVTTENVTTLNASSIFAQNANLTTLNALSIFGENSNLVTLNASSIFAQNSNLVSANVGDINVNFLTVTSNILPGTVDGNTYLEGNIIVSGNVFSSLGTPLGEGGYLYYSLASNYPPPTYTGVLYGQALALSLGTFNEQGSSSLVSRSANGNFRFSKPGIYNIRAIFLTTGDNITGIGIGSNVSDTTTRTDQTYVYRYTTFVTQNPTEIFDIQFYVGSTTAYYYVDLFAVDAPTLKPTSDPLGGSWLSIGPLQGGGGSGPPVTISTLGAVVTGRTTSYGAGVDDYYIGMSNGQTVNLPIGSSLTAGKQYIIKDESGLAGTFVGYRVTVVASSPNLIDGQDSVILALNYGAINLIWTGSFWSIY